MPLPSTFIPSDIHRLRMTATNLALIATDHGFAYLAAELENIATEKPEFMSEAEIEKLIRFINEVWSAVKTTLLAGLSYQIADTSELLK